MVPTFSQIEYVVPKLSVSAGFTDIVTEVLPLNEKGVKSFDLTPFIFLEPTVGIEPTTC